MASPTGEMVSDPTARLTAIRIPVCEPYTPSSNGRPTAVIFGKLTVIESTERPTGDWRRILRPYTYVAPKNQHVRNNQHYDRAALAPQPRARHLHDENK